MTRLKINLGCGNDYKNDSWNIDDHKPCDQIQDLNKFPYKIKSKSSNYIVCNHVLEHQAYPSKCINECYRILMDGGWLSINVPYNQQYGDIHCQNFTTEYFYYFAARGIPRKNQHDREKTQAWQGRERYRRFSRMKLRLVFPKGTQFWNYLVEPFVNWLIGICPAYYELTVLKSLFIANEIQVRYIK